MVPNLATLMVGLAQPSAIHVCPIFPACLVILKVSLCFRKQGDKPYTKAVKHHILVNF